MKILVTGSKGFIGSNLLCELRNRPDIQILEYDTDSDPRMLQLFTAECAFVYHLAGINRPRDPAMFMAGNGAFTAALLGALEKNENRAPVLLASSIQAVLHNPYGESKKAAEELLLAHARRTGAPYYIYRLPNIFGKWCRPHYNSVVATFCHDVANGLPIRVEHPEADIPLAYIDDVVQEFARIPQEDGGKSGFRQVEPVYRVKLGEIAAQIRSFQADRTVRNLPDVGDDFIKKLHGTYLSYLPPEKLEYPLEAKSDPRGSFTEFVRSPGMGQISVNRIAPGAAKGNHWHRTKSEKFMAVSGRGEFRLRRVGSRDIIRIPVSGDRPAAVDIPPGYIHRIVNTGESELIVVIWANEVYSPERPDTYYTEI